jgi:hypothetical protein
MILTLDFIASSLPYLRARTPGRTLPGRNQQRYSRKKTRLRRTGLGNIKMD